MLLIIATFMLPFFASQALCFPIFFFFFLPFFTTKPNYPVSAAAKNHPSPFHLSGNPEWQPRLTDLPPWAGGGPLEPGPASQGPRARRLGAGGPHGLPAPAPKPPPSPAPSLGLAETSRRQLRMGRSACTTLTQRPQTHCLCSHPTWVPRKPAQRKGSGLAGCL